MPLQSTIQASPGGETAELLPHIFHCSVDHEVAYSVANESTEQLTAILMLLVLKQRTSHSIYEYGAAHGSPFCICEPSFLSPRSRVSLCERLPLD